MAKLGKRSLSRLEGVDPRLVTLCHAVVKDFDITVIEGKRDLETQKKYVKEGKSKTLNPVDWENLARFNYLAGMMFAYAHMMGVKLRWGNDWDNDKLFGIKGKTKGTETFKDLVHFELI